MKKAKAPAVIYGFGEGEEEWQAQLAKSQVEIRTGANNEKPTLTKSILNILDGSSPISRLAFETDPSQINNFAGVYHAKLRLVPDSVLKRIAIQDSLVAAIVRARQNHLSSFGRPRPDRHSSGFVIKPNTGVLDKLDKEGKKKFSEQVERAVNLLSRCGHTENISQTHQKTFSEYLSLISRSAVTCGRIATEIIWGENPAGGKEFLYFANTDSGTIYRATKDHTGQESIRKEAYHLLCKLTGKKLVQEDWNQDNEYSWVQVIDGTPKEVFTSDEMKVYNIYPVPDVELDGYPVTPIDTCITAITTHVNIVTHNKMYFQSGRASRGMLVLKSDDITPPMLSMIKQQFNASINNAGNAHRMPVFGIPTDGEITWQPIDTGGGRDMEFQYLMDQNAREILSAFMMSPDELPGYTHLSRGTASQPLSESNDEYKLTAARDVGLRPLLTSIEDFINQELFPLIDLDLSKKAVVRLVGLESLTPEDESKQVSTQASVFLSFDDVLQKVEKDPVGSEWAGNIPLNPVYKSYLDHYFTIGEVLEHFCGRKGASQDPKLAYIPDPLWLQWQTLLFQQQLAQQKAQQPQPDQSGQEAGTAPNQQGNNTNQNPQSTQEEEGLGKGPNSKGSSESIQGGEDLGKAISQAFNIMKKSEDNLPADKRRILQQHKKTVDYFIKGFESDIKLGTKEILDIAKQFSPRK